MRTQLIGFAAAATTVIALAGCNDGTNTPSASSASAVGGLGSAPSNSTSARTATSTATATTTHGSTPKSSHSTTTSAAPAGPRVVYFKVAQKPKCPEGTAVFRAPAVSLIISWKIAGATGGALSVDDPTNTPGTYGQVALEGTEEFSFSCAGDVGSTETHTYAIYTVGGGTQQHKKLTVSAKILDKGPNSK